MNEEQLKAIRQITTKNQEFLDAIEDYYNSIKVYYKEYEGVIIEFYQEIEKMEQASSREYIEPYCNAYYLENNEFVTPVGKCVKDSIYMTLNEGWGYLKEQYLETIRLRYYNIFLDLEERVKDNSYKFQDLYKQIYAYNKVCKYFEEVDELYNNLVSHVSLEYKVTEDSIEYKVQKIRDNHKSSKKFTLPVHTELRLRYEPVFIQMKMHIESMQIIRDFLINIVHMLPFVNKK
ncbi:MAG: hypothetical protein RR840_07330 [Clostridium sp.]